MRLSLFIALLGLVQCVQAADFFNRFSAEAMGENVYVIHGPMEYPSVSNRGFMNNPAFIVGDKSVVVVDPGSTLETGNMVLREIAKVTDKPVSHIINTHIHGDHWLANDSITRQYPDVVIYADPRMIKKARAGAAQNWLDNMKRLTDGISAETKIVYPGEPVGHGQQLKLAGMTFNVYSHGIAHSDSDIMIEYVEGSVFFTGDNVGYKRILRMDDGHYRDLIKALDMAIERNAKVYVPGHGPSGDVSRIELQREYYATLYEQVEKYYEEGLEDFEMKPMVEAALEKFQGWNGFEDELGKHISLAKLEIEKAEFE